MRTVTAGAAAGAIAVIVNLLLLVAFKPLTGAPTLLALSVGPVVMWTVVGTIGATIAFAVIRRVARNPNRTFLIVAVAVLLVSFVPDVLIVGATDGMFAGATWAAATLLMCMHVAAAVILVGGLTRFASAR